jgi:hypothetical protein
MLVLLFSNREEEHENILYRTEREKKKKACLFQEDIL